MKFIETKNQINTDADHKVSKRELINVIDNAVRGKRSSLDNDDMTMTLSDVSVVDILLKIIINKDFSTVDCPVDKSTLKVICVSAIENFTHPTEREQIDMMNYHKFNHRFNMLLDSLRDDSHDMLLKKMSTSVVLADNSVLSLTFLKVSILHEDSNLVEVHYMLPLVPVSRMSAPTFEMLTIDGSGVPRFVALPLLNEDTIKVSSIVNELMGKCAYGYATLDKINADHAVVVPVADYSRRYSLAFNAPCNVTDGIGFTLSPQSDKFLSTFNNKYFVSEFDYDKLGEMRNDILLYDNRTYLDKIAGEIDISVLSDSEISFNGFYMDEDLEEKRDTMMLAEFTSATSLGRAGNKVKRLPFATLEEMKKKMSTIRNFLVQYKKAEDDALREKLINDEFVPILDNSMKWLISGTVTFGGIFVLGAGPLLSLLAGVIALVVKNEKDKENRNRVTRMIQDELSLVDEKINDARNSDDRAQKYNLMRIKKSLLRKMDRVTFENKL